MRRLFVPEVVQTSALDCGPAALKSLLEGFRIPVSYGRLREACQTGLDGTSIDALETVATSLGLEAEQLMLPADHVVIAEANALPAIVVVTLPGGLTHFVVVWRRYGNRLEVMDPSVGRRWILIGEFQEQIYRHSAQVPATAWREFAGSSEFQLPLRRRLQSVGLTEKDARAMLSEASQDVSWRAIAALDAAGRALVALRNAGAINGSRHARDAVATLMREPENIPAQFWCVAPAGTDTDGEEQLFFRGAVLLRALARKKESPAFAALPPDLAAAVSTSATHPIRELWRMLAARDWLTLAYLFMAVPLAVAGLLLETLLFRGLFDFAGQLHTAGQRIGAMSALVLFSAILLSLELTSFRGITRLCRHFELRLRVAFHRKIPRLGDRYFQSRLISDMGERCHVAHRLRNVIEFGRQAIAAMAEMLGTAAGIIWLEPATAPFVLCAVAAAVVPSVLSRSLLAESDLRVRSHAAALTRFYLDGALGFTSIRSHGAEENVQRSHADRLTDWIRAAMRMQRFVVTLEALQTLGMFGTIAAMFMLHPLSGANAGRLLLVAYWALNLPALGQNLGVLARQYPYYRSLALRICEPLGAPDDASATDAGETTYESAPSIEFENVTAEACGHTILSNINLRIEPESHVAIVGRSGAGKSSLLGLLLGWLGSKEGRVLVNGEPVDVGKLRRSAAWVDPAIQLWNRSLFENLRFGSQALPDAVGKAVEAAHLRGVLQELPGGLQAGLGEGGGKLSGGEGQRVRLGRAILHSEARLILLDEPFRGLDREMRARLLKEARERWHGCTLLCVTHDLAETRQFARVLVVENGRIVEDGIPETLWNTPGSRYRELLEAERNVRSWLWNARPWRRIRVQRGSVLEQTHSAAIPETEVA